MIRHIILWSMKETLSEEEKQQAKNNIKQGLEALAGVVPGLKEIHVYTQPEETSNYDLMLDSLFDDMEALKGYHHHPAHLQVKNNITEPAVSSRACFDFEI